MQTLSCAPILTNEQTHSDETFFCCKFHLLYELKTGTVFCLFVYLIGCIAETVSRSSLDFLIGLSISDCKINDKNILNLENRSWEKQNGNNWASKSSCFQFWSSWKVSGMFEDGSTRVHHHHHHHPHAGRDTPLNTTVINIQNKKRNKRQKNDKVLDYSTSQWIFSL